MLLLTIIFYSSLALWTILMGILSIPFIVLPSKFMRFPAKVWIKGIFILLKYICGVTHEVRGLENITNEPLIIVSKHQSAFETFALYYYLESSFFIHKKQLFYIPIFGQYLLKSNMVSIDRTEQAKGEDSFQLMAIRALFIIDRVVIEEMNGGVDLEKNIWYIPNTE